ncbi:phenylalanine--tRNA ligase subunit beta [Patescibacteria group bacterium]|nr:phenylalanine--tRNA ligase subunit beta [Patescibacteria group bacterium]
MNISLNWLKQYVEIPEDLDPKELGLKMTMATVEVEEVKSLGSDYDKIVVGQVKEIVKHPDADKLQVCQVDIGAKERATIVCGGINLEKDMYCIVALPGSKVRWHGKGDLVELEETKIRGVKSFGMICAASEVGLGHMFEQGSEAEIVDLGKGEFKAGDGIAKALKIDDIVYDIDNKSLTHRPDLWSHFGMAREVSAILRKPLKPLEIYEIRSGSGSKLKVDIKDSELCPRYQAVVISGIKIGKSPEWLKNYLQSIGVKAINNIVDITNYILFDLGQPLHAFDANNIDGNKIIVRRAEKDEKIKTLDDIEHKLNTDNLVIADSKKAIAIAGVMGGANSEIGDSTDTIILESANFHAASIRKTANQLGMRTEASMRFEKSLDPELTALALAKAAQLVKQVCPDAKVISKVIDIDKSKKESVIIKLTYSWLLKRIGTEIPLKNIIEILEALQFEIKVKDEDIIVTVPSWRATKDISIPEDIIEEVARIYGYDLIPDELPKIRLSQTDIQPIKKAEYKVKSIMSEHFALNEVYNYSWQAEEYLKAINGDVKDCIALLNYLSPEQQYLRISLLPNLLKNVVDNLRWYDEIDIFELGRIFTKQSGKKVADNDSDKMLPYQPRILSWLRYNKKDLFYEMKGEVEYLLDKLEINYEWKKIAKHDYYDISRTLALYSQDELLGYCGVLQSSILKKLKLKNIITTAELNFTEMIKYMSDSKEYVQLPKYPVVVKDFSVILNNDIDWQDLSKDILSLNKEIRSIDLFDKYLNEKTGEFSVAFHIRIYSEEKTLTTKEIEVITSKIMNLLEKKYKLTIKKQ